MPALSTTLSWHQEGDDATAALQLAARATITDAQDSVLPASCWPAAD